MSWRRPRSAGPGPRTVIRDGEPLPPSRTPTGGVTVEVPTVDRLPAVLLAVAGRLSTDDLVVQVQGWRRPVPGWVVPVPELPGALEQSVRVAADSEAGPGLRVSVRLDAPTDLGVLLHAVLRAVAPQGPAPGPVTADVAALVPLPPGAAPLLPFVSRLVLPDEPPEERIRATDVVVRAGSAGAATDLPHRDVLVVGPERVGDRALVVDQLVHTPRGRTGRSRLDVAVLTRRDGVHVLARSGRAGDQRPEVVLAAGGPTVEQLPALLELGRCRVADDVDVDVAAPLLLALSATGLPVALSTSSAEQLIRRGVAPDLAQAWAEPSDDDLLGQVTDSVRQRRDAHRQHGAAAVVRRAGAASGDVPAAPTVSAVLVTMRPERLGFALAQVASSTYPALQLVLGLHGGAFDRGEVDRLVVEHGLRERTVVVPLGEELSFGAAFGTAMAAADGALVTKLDDDDHYGPEHVWDLVVARDYSGAQFVGKPPEFVHLESLDVTVHRTGYRREEYGPFVAGGTILAARADIESVGGWRPVPRSIDRGLLERVERAGGTGYATHGVGYVYVRHDDGHTWDPGLAHFLRATGEQWSGLVAHAEFGTAPARAGAAQPSVSSPSR